MTRVIRAVLACVLLAGCGTTALEPQNVALRSGMARIYLMRPSTLLGKAARYSIAVDDKPVGKITDGSYVSVDRAPGRHKIAVMTIYGTPAIEDEIQVEAGRSYYFVINMRSSQTAVVSNGLVMAVPIPGTAIGKPVSQQKWFSGIYFGQLDSTAGAAMVASLQKP
ncbi:hypothetical protein ASD45_08705 [Pseudolabrys sp. Root1462]|nr:hypothetical protein ASD45_08705 [Pseudolabrys sp. Root1462]